MRIMFVVCSDYYHPSLPDNLPLGIAVYTRGLSRALVAAGHDVSIVAIRMTDRVAQVEDQYQFEGSTVHMIPGELFTSSFACSQYVHELLLVYPQDVVEAHQYRGALLVEQLLGGTPTVVRYASDFSDHLSGAKFDFNGVYGISSLLVPKRSLAWSANLGEIRTTELADLVLCGSEKMIVRASEYSDHCAFVPLGIPETIAPSESLLEFRQKERHVLVSVGRFMDPRKGGEFAERIAKALIALGKRVTILGEAFGKRRKDLELFCSRSGVEGLFDPIEEKDLVSLYKNCEFVVVPTKSESFGLVLLEPMAYGTPVVSFYLESDDPSKRHWPLLRMGPWSDDSCVDKALPKIVELLGSEGKYVDHCSDCLNFAQEHRWSERLDGYLEAYNRAIANAILKARTRGI